MKLLIYNLILPIKTSESVGAYVRRIGMLWIKDNPNLLIIFFSFLDAGNLYPTWSFMYGFQDANLFEEALTLHFISLQTLLRLLMKSSVFNSAWAKSASHPVSVWMTASRKQDTPTSLLWCTWRLMPVKVVTVRHTMPRGCMPFVERATLWTCYRNLELVKNGQKTWRKKLEAKVLNNFMWWLSLQLSTAIQVLVHCKQWSKTSFFLHLV